MDKTILITDIKINRELRDDDDLSNLGSTEDWLPVVVSDQFELIDGLRRIRKAESLGYTHIMAYIVSTLEEASEALAQQHTTPLKDWDRVYQLLTHLRPLMEKRWMLIRQNNIKILAGVPQDPTSPRGQSRPYITKALGGVSPAHWEVLERLYDGRLNPKWLEEVRSGRLTPSGAVNRAQRAPKQGNVSEVEDQTVLIATASQFMLAAARALEQLEWPLKTPQEELSELTNSIRKARRKITHFLNRQSEEAENK